MRRSLRKVVFGVFAVTLTTAAVLGYVARGDAAGTNICPNAVCLSTVVSPHVTSAVPTEGFAAFAAGRFDNSSSSTATHLNLTLAFKNVTTDPVTDATVKIDTSRIATLVDGSPVAATCTPARAPTQTIVISTVSCSFPNLAGGHVAKLQVPFTPEDPSGENSKIKAILTATYGEGNGGTNDFQTSSDAVSDTLTIGGTSAAGKCTFGGSQLGLPKVSNSNATASIGVPNYPAAATTTDQNLPCTAAGIQALDDQITVGGVKGHIVSLELPKVVTGFFATVVHDVTPLPPNTTVRKLVISESLGTVFNLTVPPCDSNGFPPSPASSGFSADTCVFDRSGLPKGGGRFIMHSIGVNVDPRYTP
jgi:hypothetical protein